jgi:hypothetical protein
MTMEVTFRMEVRVREMSRAELLKHIGAGERMLRTEHLREQLGQECVERTQVWIQLYKAELDRRNSPVTR